MNHTYKIGDKVWIATEPPRFEDDPGICPAMAEYFGKEVTISEERGNGHWAIQEDPDKWSWDERWFVKSQENNNLITISFDPSDKAAAHKMVEEAIKSYYAPKDWTEEEIGKAKDLVCDMAMSLIRNNGDVFFNEDIDDDKIIRCSVYLNSFNSCPDRETESCPYGKDIYNVWIGKCVALCKALKKPIPDFIRYKNT